MRIFQLPKKGKRPGGKAEAASAKPVDWSAVFDRPRAETTLELAASSLTSCTDSFDWLNDANVALKIAQRIDEALIDFPELELHYRRSDMAANALAMFGEPLRAAAIAHVLAPEDESIVERLLLALARAQAWSALSSKVRSYRPHENIDALIARLALDLACAASGNGALKAIEVLSARVTDSTSIAAFRLGDALANLIRFADTDGARVAAFAGSIARSRDLIQRYGAGADTGAGRAVSASGGLDAGGVLRLARKIADRIPQSRPVSTPAPARAAAESGVVSWTSIAMNAFGVIDVPAPKFLSNYANMDGGFYCGEMHNVGEPFIFGPYLTLPEGFYVLTFFGEAERGLAYELTASTNFGANKLAMNVVVAAGQNDPAVGLGELRFHVPKGAPPMEFTIRPLAFCGKLAFSGITLTRPTAGSADTTLS